MLNFLVHAFRSEFDTVKILLVNTKQYPVSYAIKNSMLDVLDFYLKYSVLDDKIEPQYKTALKQAICLKNTMVVKLIKYAYPNFLDEDGSLEENIIKFGTPEMVDFLPQNFLKTAIEHDLDGAFCSLFSTFNNINGEHPLFYAIFYKNLKYLEHMLNLGVSPNIKNKQQNTPTEDILTYFDDFRDLFMIQKLMERGAKIKRNILKQIPESIKKADLKLLE